MSNSVEDWTLPIIGPNPASDPDTTPPPPGSTSPTGPPTDPEVPAMDYDDEPQPEEGGRGDNAIVTITPVDPAPELETEGDEGLPETVMLLVLVAGSATVFLLLSCAPRCAFACCRDAAVSCLLDMSCAPCCAFACC